MGFFARIRKRRAFRQIARTMPVCLLDRCGPGPYYTPEQIQSAWHETGCSVDYLIYAYAMFCDTQAFSSACEGDYEVLRGEAADVLFAGNSDFTIDDFERHTPNDDSSYADDGDGNYDDGGSDGGGDD